MSDNSMPTFLGELLRSRLPRVVGTGATLDALQKIPENIGGNHKSLEHICQKYRKCSPTSGFAKSVGTEKTPPPDDYLGADSAISRKKTMPNEIPCLAAGRALSPF